MKRIKSEKSRKKEHIMSMIKCKECKEQISNKAHKCPNCGVVLKELTRTFTGHVFNTLFALFNFLMMVITLVWGALVMSGGGGIGIISIPLMVFYMLVIWIFIGIPLAIMSYLTRPEAYQ